MILGGGPNRIGQGIEFDYCCVHAAFALKEDGLRPSWSIRIPKPFRPITTRATSCFSSRSRSRTCCTFTNAKCWGAIAQFGGQTPLNLALGLQKNGVNIIGTSPQSIEIAEDRKLFAAMLDKLNIPQPPNGLATNEPRRSPPPKTLGYPGAGPASFVLGGRAMQIVYSDAELRIT
jgi:carbamoyl-phosphate synthase large subunit